MKLDVVFVLLSLGLALSLAGRLARAQGLNPNQQFSATFGRKTATSHDASMFGQHDSSPQPMDFITGRGFIGEAFNVLSRGGETITVYHIINPLADQRTLNKYPAFVCHGLSGDASQLLSTSDASKPRRPIIGQTTYDEGDISLPFMLANNNFDVYMLDARGTNLNSREMSTDLNPIEANRYWNYTLDEQAQLDLPTAIDFVLQQAGSDKLHYVGYSESTLFMFALLSRQLHYQDKLASFVAIAPVAYLTNLRGSILTLLVTASLTPDQVNGNYLPQPISDTLGASIRSVCSYRLVGSTLCNFAAKGLAGQGMNDVDPSELFLTAFKATSIKSLKHFYQLHTQKRFGMYDYGPEGNMRQYGQISPPAYNLANIKLPTIILARGGTDYLSTPEDQRILISKLGTRPYLDIDLPKYNHLDFFDYKPAIFEVNIPIVKAMLQILKAYNPSGNILRDDTAVPKRFTPVTVRMPSLSRRVEVKSNLLPNLIEGLMESKNLERFKKIPTDLFGGVNLPTFG